MTMGYIHGKIPATTLKRKNNCIPKFMFFFFKLFSRFIYKTVFKIQTKQRASLECAVHILTNLVTFKFDNRFYIWIFVCCWSVYNTTRFAILYPYKFFKTLRQFNNKKKILKIKVKPIFVAQVQKIKKYIFHIILFQQHI